MTTDPKIYTAAEVENAGFSKEEIDQAVAKVPLRPKTADQLKVGHLFTGRKLNGPPREYLLCASGGEEDVLVLWARDFTWTTLQARDWEVITDHGPLQKPEVN